MKKMESEWEGVGHGTNSPGENRVFCMARHSETGEEMVVYQALYGERGIWVRPASMWNETVERDGKTFQRFTYTGE